MTTRDLGIDLRDMIAKYALWAWCNRILELNDRLLDPKLKGNPEKERQAVYQAESYYHYAMERLRSNSELVD